jgi:hypothetical protein
MMTVTLIIRQETEADGLTVVTIQQPGTAGIKGTEEKRNIPKAGGDKMWRDHEDHVFGHVKGIYVNATLTDSTNIYEKDIPNGSQTPSSATLMKMRHSSRPDGSMVQTISTHTSKAKEMVGLPAKFGDSQKLRVAERSFENTSDE